MKDLCDRVFSVSSYQVLGKALLLSGKFVDTATPASQQYAIVTPRGVSCEVMPIDEAQFKINRQKPWRLLQNSATLRLGDVAEVTTEKMLHRALCQAQQKQTPTLEDVLKTQPSDADLPVIRREPIQPRRVYIDRCDCGDDLLISVTTLPRADQLVLAKFFMKHVKDERHLLSELHRRFPKVVPSALRRAKQAALVAS